VGKKIVIDVYNILMPHIEASYIKELRIGLGFMGFMLLAGTVYAFFNSKEQS